MLHVGSSRAHGRSEFREVSSRIWEAPSSFEEIAWKREATHAEMSRVERRNCCQLCESCHSPQTVARRSSYYCFAQKGNLALFLKYCYPIFLHILAGVIIIFCGFRKSRKLGRWWTQLMKRRRELEKRFNRSNLRSQTWANSSSRALGCPWVRNIGQLEKTSRILNPRIILNLP